MGVELGSNQLKRLADRIGMNMDITFDIPVNKSIFPYDTMGKTDMAAVAMGQGNTFTISYGTDYSRHS